MDITYMWAEAWLILVDATWHYAVEFVLQRGFHLPMVMTNHV